MKNKPIIVLSGDPQSIFFEIFFKSLKKNNFKSPLILISSLKILRSQMKKNKFKRSIRLININDIKKNLNNKMINIINVDYDELNSKKQKFKKILYLKKCFEISFKILKMGLSYKFINGPINKSTFLDKRYLGITEYISKKFKIKKFAMLI